MLASHSTNPPKKNKQTVLSLDVGPSRARGALGSAGSELVVFGLDLAQVGLSSLTYGRMSMRWFDGLDWIVRLCA